MKNITQLIGRKEWYLFTIVAAFLGFHLLYINTPFVNLEWVYRQGSQYFLTHDTESLKQYFYRQANPLQYSFLSSIIVNLFGDHYASYRVLALLGGTLVLFMLIKYKEPYLLLIVGLNPIIWIYTGRAYSEMISVGIMLMALETSRNGVLKGILGAFAAVIKYHSILVSVCYWGISWFDNIFNRKSKVWCDKNFLAGSISIIGLFAFFLAYYQELGIWLIPDQFKKLYSFNYLNTINNFFSYGFYLAGMFFLTIPFLLRNTTWRWKIAAITISLPVALLNENKGEMDFGSFNQLLGAEIILLIKIIGFWNFLLCCKLFWNDEKSRILLLTVLLYMALLSLTRPAQRYLIFVIPFWAIMICIRLEIHRVVQVSYVLILCGLNLFATLYQVQNARASADIAAWSQSKDIQINSAIIFPHVGEFSHHDLKSKITVTMNPQPNDKILFRRVVKVLSYPLREYFVIQPYDDS